MLGAKYEVIKKAEDRSLFKQAAIKVGLDVPKSLFAHNLEEAKKLGNTLIVGLNSDQSITKLKGSNRPYNKLEYRIKQLEMLNIVDYIIVFNEQTPINLIKIIQPDILVKGGDYKIENMIGREIPKLPLPTELGEGPVYNPEARPPRNNNFKKKTFNKPRR